jgi:hypothetical protein
MKKILTLALVALFVSMVMPFSVFAQTPTPAKGADGGEGSGKPEESSFRLVPCQGVDNPVTTDVIETECDFKMLLVAVSRIMKFLLFLSIPLVMGMGFYTAFKFMTAGGDPGKLADAKKMFVPVVLGIFWVMAAYLVVYTFLDKLVKPDISGEAKGAIKILDNR